MRAATLLCLVAALWLGVAELRANGGRPQVAARVSLLPRVARRYDASRAGRRLAARLWSSQIPLSPTAWRAAQAMLAVPVATVAIGLGAAPVAALLTAMTVTRSGGTLLLRLRRRAVLAAVDGAAPQMARALATELAAWGSGGQALSGAARRCQASVAAGRVLQGAAARVLLGGDAASALQRSLDDSAPGLPPTAAAARVAAVFALHRHDAAATAEALHRLASALEVEAATANDARSATAEVRMSAVAVPLLAAATLVMLLIGDPAALAAALSLPLFPFLGVGAVVVAAASFAARRVVAV